MGMMIFGLDIIVLALIITITNGAIHQVRTYKGKTINQIINAVLVTIASSFTVSYITLTQIISLGEFEQVLAILVLIGGTVPAGVLSQKAFAKVQQKRIHTPKIKTEKKNSVSDLQNTIPNKKEESIVIINDDTKTPKIKQKMLPPKLYPEGSWYQTNFSKSKKGNTLQFGQIYLWIKLNGARSYVTAVLYDEKMRVLQIDQSTIHDEDNDIETTRLELLTAEGKAFPKGVYYIRPNGDVGTGDSQGVLDKFEIV